MAEYPVGATATTFRVVDALRASQPAGVTELAARLDLSKSAVHNHLTTLEALDFAINDEGTYRLSLRFLDYGTSVRDEHETVRAGRGAVDSLAAQSGATASLVVPEFDRAVYAYAPPNPNAAGSSDGVRTGTRVPLHACASGKAILSCRSKAAVQAYIDDNELVGRTDQTITDPARLRTELRSVRDRGIAFDRGEAVDGVHSVAAPVSVDDDPVGAVAVSGPAERLSGKRLQEDLPGLVLNHVKNLELDLAN
jgi:DNA-binding IclR family transcriptional regulator